MKLNQYYIHDNMSLNNDCDILQDVDTILINDDNLKPDWVEKPAKYTEFHIKRNKKELLVVIGESWTYGETLNGIATALEKYNFKSQLRHCYGSRMAVSLNCDLYQYAVPGNCNYYMFSELERILDYVNTLGYSKIYVSMQMTEPSRENSILSLVQEKNHPLKYLLNSEQAMTLEHWLEKYDEIFFTQYNDILSKYTDVHIDAVLWKNFCRINTSMQYNKFKIINITWIEYSSRIMGNRVSAPSFYSIGWLDTIMESPLYRAIKFEIPYMKREVDLIEASNKFIHANFFHSHHPNEYAHLLWAQYVLRKSGWISDI